MLTAILLVISRFQGYIHYYKPFFMLHCYVQGSKSAHFNTGLFGDNLHRLSFQNFTIQIPVFVKFLSLLQLWCLQFKQSPAHNKRLASLSSLSGIKLSYFIFTFFFNLQISVPKSATNANRPTLSLCLFGISWLFNFI